MSDIDNQNVEKVEKVESKKEGLSGFKTSEKEVEQDGVSTAVMERRIEASGISSNYERKVFILNRVMNDHIGMGRFQWSLFLLCGLGEYLDRACSRVQ